ncbi:MAG: PAS domain-containing protein, partial [Blastocatellia bacterium]
MTAKRPLILIVDDAPEDISAYKRHLTRGSNPRYRIQESATGAKALAMCQRQTPDCVLLNFRLPDITGLEILRAFVAGSGTPPCAVIMLAEISDTQIAVEAMKYGAHDFLEKSLITPELLRRAVANAIEKAALQREVEEQRRELAIKNLMLEQRLADLQREINERQQAETALRISEERLRLALSFAGMGTWDWDRATSREVWSAEHFKIMGYPEMPDGAEAPVEWWNDRIHPNDRERCLQAIRDARVNGATYSLEHRILRADDQRTIWLDVRGRFLRDKKGDPIRMLGVVQDITKRKQAEEALGAIEHRFKRLIEALPGVVWMSDETGAVTYLNDHWTDLTGLTLEQSLGAGWLAPVHPDDAMRLETEWMQTVTTGAPHESRHRYLRRDGEYRWHLCRAIPLRDEGAAIREWIGVSIDIHDRYEAERALSESEARYRALVEATSQLVWTADANGISDISWKWWSKVTGLPVERLRSGRWIETVHPDDRQQLRSVSRALSRETQASFEIGFRLLARDGEYRHFSVRGVPLGAGGAFNGWIGTLDDVTEEGRAEEALKLANERFTVAEAASNGYVYDRNPDSNSVQRSPGFGAVLGYSESETAETFDWWKQLIHPDDIARVKETLGQMLSSRKTDEFAPSDGYSFEYRIRHKDGRCLWVWDRGKLMRDGAGRVQRVIGSVVDITERKRAEEALRESEEKFSKVFKASPHRTAITTLDEGRYIDVNDAVLRGSGYEREEMIGHTGAELRIFAEPEGREKLTSALRNGSVNELEIRLRSKSGEVRTVLMSAEILTLNGRECILAISNDITERKRAEEALRESEERFRALANTIPSIIWMAVADGTITFHNQQWVDYCGVSPEQNGDWLQLVIHPDDLESCLAEWTRASELGSEFETELRLRRRDGEYRWFLTRATPAPDAEGHVANWFGVVTDIHDHKQAEEARRESDERLKLAMEAAGMFAWETDIASGRVTWSDFGEKMMGMDPGSFGGTFDAFLALVHPDDRESVLGARKRALRGEGPYEVEYRKMRPDGGIQWGISRGLVHRDDRGRPERLVGVNLDITKRKQMEDALRLSEERYRLLVSTSSQVVITADATGGNPDSGSGWWERLTGQTWDESRNQGWMKCVHPDDSAAAAATWRKAIAEQKPFESEFRVRTRDGDYHWLRSTGAPIRDAGGNFREWAVALRDITERKQAEEKLREKERFIQSLVDAVPSGIYIYDVKERRNVFINPRLASQLGYTAHELKDMGPDFLPTLLHPEDWERASAHFEMLRKAPDGSVLGLEFRMKHSSGEWRWFICRELVFMRDPDGWPRQILGAAQEITDRIQAEEKLREKEKFIQSLIDTVPLGIYIFDLWEMSAVFTNSQMASLHGYAAGEIEAMESEMIPRIIHPDDQELIYEHLERLRNAPDGAVSAVECRVKHRSGEWRWLASRDLVFTRDADGRPQRILGVTQDITDRKLAEEALQHANRRYQIALSAFDGYVYDYNVRDKTSERSEGFAKLIGYKLEEVSKQADWWFDLIHPDDRDRFLSKVEKILTEVSMETAYSAEYRVRHKEGHYIDVLDRKLIVRDTEGRSAQVVGAVINITEHKRAEEALRESAEHLRLAMAAAGAGSFDWDIASGALVWA